MPNPPISFDRGGCLGLPAVQSAELGPTSAIDMRRWGKQMRCRPTHLTSWRTVRPNEQYLGGWHRSVPR